MRNAPTTIRTTRIGMIVSSTAPPAPTSTISVTTAASAPSSAERQLYAVPTASTIVIASAASTEHATNAVSASGQRCVIHSDDSAGGVLAQGGRRSGWYSVVEGPASLEGCCQ